MRKNGRTYRKEPRNMVSAEKFGRYKEEAEEGIGRRERLALRNKVNSEKHLRYIRGIKRRDTHENLLARPTGLRENAETAISCR